MPRLNYQFLGEPAPQCQGEWVNSLNAARFSTRDVQRTDFSQAFPDPRKTRLKSVL